MKTLRALAYVITILCIVLALDTLPGVKAQSGLPWSDTCASEQTTCNANYNQDLLNCENGCKGNGTCVQNCRKEYAASASECASAYQSCLQGRTTTCGTYCNTACGTTQYVRYMETNSTPDCQCGCSTANACGGTALYCNYGITVCQYDKDSGQFGYTCPQCYGPPPDCAGGPSGLSTCKNTPSGGMAQWICPTGGCGNTPAPSCSTGVATCASGSWSCPKGSTSGPPQPPGNGCTDVCNPQCTNFNPCQCNSNQCACDSTYCPPPPTCSPETEPGCNNPTCVGTTWECNDSPILIDVKGEGFHLTNAANGVLFDFSGNGQMVQLAWTDPNYSNAWLAFDRNGNGLIDNATELFGNITAQPDSATPNGFLALAVFDKLENGGNGNGFIDPGDAIYSKLRLWIDSNHNGVSEPEELFTLDEMHVRRIELNYHEIQQVDSYGNLFRYRSRIWDERGVTPDRWTYDVFLQVEP